MLNDSFVKQIEVLNINELKRLSDKTDEATEQIKDQDIILLLGDTRDGKSTTAHTLAGSKMEWKEINGIDTIIAQEVYN